jgi:hypothetical protein
MGEKINRSAIRLRGYRRFGETAFAWAVSEGWLNRVINRKRFSPPCS